MPSRPLPVRSTQRRALLGLAAAATALAGGVAWGQSQRVARVGILTPNSRQPRVADVIKALGELGYQPGRNVVFEIRSADDALERLEPLAVELARLPVDVIIPIQTPAAHAARRASTTVPIVMAGAALDPVAAGLAQSLARPGGNVTGVVGLGANLAAKTLELVRELRAPTRRIGALVNAADPFTPALLEMLQQAARALEIELRVAQVRAADSYEPPFAGWSAARVDAVFVQPSLVLDKAIALAAQHRLVSFSFVRQFATTGGLLSYSADSREAAQRTASFVDRILKGADPGQLPIEQPTSFELVLNRGTAKTLGVTIPNSLLLRATDVIG
jgi:putative tryptophan/tyrosine transport system substrate-binding protein